MDDPKNGGITLADLVTLAGYGLGLWWSSGGPGWAALASMACDELDGPIARRLGTAGPGGAALDWGSDIALTPLALLRVSRDLNRPAIATVGAPLVLAAQARLKAQGAAPPVGSARALIMLAGLAIEHQTQRPNPRKRRQR